MGFSSSIKNYIDHGLDLNELLISSPSSTFFIRVKGDSFVKAGIYSNDILIVDRSLSVSDNKIVIAIYNNELAIKRVKILENGIFLTCVNNDNGAETIKITDQIDCEIWGIVVFVIHKL